MKLMKAGTESQEFDRLQNRTSHLTINSTSLEAQLEKCGRFVKIIEGSKAELKFASLNWFERLREWVLHFSVFKRTSVDVFEKVNCKKLLESRAAKIEDSSDKTKTSAAKVVVTTAAQNGQPIKLYGHPLSPYVRKVMSTLENKHIAYDLDPTFPAKHLKILKKDVPAEFQEASPLGKIPAVRVEEGSLADSSVIIAYLEKKWPNDSLYPTDPYLQAKALWFEKYADTAMTDVFHRLFAEKVAKKVVFNKAGDEAVINELLPKVPEILQYLENSLEASKTRFLVTNELTVGDVAVLHLFVGLQYAEIKLDLSNCPRVAQYLKDGLAHPSIQKVVEKVPYKV
jgi:glutathione S-transferase